MQSPEFTTNRTRYDPYKNFRFKVKIGNDYVMACSRVDNLERSTKSSDPITLESGLTCDPTFEAWANNVSSKDVRKDIIIELYNESGQEAIAYKVYRCWVSSYQALPELDGTGNETAITSITLENEGWERDTSQKDWLPVLDSNQRPID